MDPKTVGISSALNLGLKIQWNKSLVLGWQLGGEGPVLEKVFQQIFAQARNPPPQSY